MAPLRYDPREIDRKWQQRWADDNLYHVNDDDPRPRWYALTMYPYPSGDLHIGHWYAMAPSDAHARFMRMRGYNVLHPMGFDSFGLPAENAAINRGIHPAKWTMENIERMRSQLRSMGAVYDWDREIVTSQPEYYAWNQWFFLKMYESGLAYRASAPVNWCPTCQTVLANEQVVDGKCERTGDVVIRREMDQWFFRITDYADELLDFSSVVDWPERIKTMQTNWIGRSEGVDISFDISEYGLDEREITTFTTRIDTIFGVTFVVLAPEHPLVERLTTPEQRDAVQAYVGRAREATEIDRLSVEREKTGVFTGSYAVNPLNGDRVPIWVGDYVLLTYGTGAVMGVPAHDARDFDFALKYGLEIRVVVAPPGWNGGPLREAWLEKRGTQVNSGQFDGMPNAEGYEAIADHVEQQSWGKRTVGYRMRDWLISRQRYWGTPIPVVYCDDCGIRPVPYGQLPVVLPDDAQFKPTGESPLRYHDGFLHTTCPDCDGPATRETDTMDTFVDSSWYFLRYVSPEFTEGPFDPARVSSWNPVDQYTGGAEHAVMHLLYARFFTKVVRDLGLIDFGEPFLRLFNQGTVLSDHMKMSKSRGNVIAPDEYVQELGADVVRLYLMFMGPWEGGGDWSDSGINGVARWVNRLWDLCLRDPDALPEGEAASDRAIVRKTHQTIRSVVEGLERFKYNTALATMMELTNEMSPAYDVGAVSRGAWNEAVESLLLLLAPMGPHLAEELWERTGHAYSVHNQPLPEWDEALAAIEEATLVVQVNGKVRDRIAVPASISEGDAKEAALTSQKVMAWTDGKSVDKVVFVPGRYLVSVVVKD
ncbi:MAG: leucine--tRNA ligase [Chloroflexota bacterium]|nr:leucine--tRNA ligase [Chloroflexota bacterium]MDE2883749.1 leucine--tRNA ligase [Chloroflexota bacterium]